MAGKWEGMGLDPDYDTAIQDSHDSNIEDSTESGTDTQGDTQGDTQTADRPLLLLTEIMIDPDIVSDDVGEWFEIRNVGSLDIDLKDIEVRGPDGDSFSFSTSVIVAPDAQVVIATSGDSAVNGGFQANYVYSIDDLKLSNEGGNLSLWVNNALIDSVIWDTFPNEKGHSISLDPSAFNATENDLAEHWCAAADRFGAGDYGSPGILNAACAPVISDQDQDGVADTEDCNPTDASIYADAPELLDDKDNDCDGWIDEHPPTLGDLIITEIMDDPDPTDDDDGEWFEIQNISTDPIEILNLDISDTGGESFVVEDAFILNANEILLFGASADSTRNDGIVPDYVFDTSIFHLGNDVDEVLLSFNGVLVDEVDYDSDFPHQKGKSRSLDALGMSESRNDDAGYWCEGDGNYGLEGNQGTPGQSNDTCP